MPEPAGNSKQKRAKAGRLRRWNWLLLVPLALLVYPETYSRTTPVALGFPFFYWRYGRGIAG